MRDKILFIDTETGGINPHESSLLSIGLVVWSDNKVIDSKEILIKQKVFKITPQALKVNKIDMLSFLDAAVEPEKALLELIDFCEKHFKEQKPITLGGHNTNFDVDFVKYFMSENGADFQKYFSHRFIDTASILKYLYYGGILESDLSSSDKAFSYFNISVVNRHSALGDALATSELFTRLLELLPSKG